MTLGDALQDRFLRVLIALGAICAFLMVYGFATTERQRPGPLRPSLAEAAERTASYPGMRMSMTGSINVPEAAGGVLRVTGDGVLNGETQRARVDLKTVGMPTPPGDFSMTEVVDGGVFYVYSPVFAGALPNGRTWLKVDLTDVIDSDSMSMGDPREYLQQLRAAGSVREVAEEPVRGVTTTHYAAVVQFDLYLQQLRAEGRNRTADAMKELRSQSGIDQLPTDVWVDDEGLIRRQTMAIPLGSQDGRKEEMQLTVEFFDFGAAPAIDLPYKERVFDASAASQDRIDAPLV